MDTLIIWCLAFSIGAVLLLLYTVIEMMLKNWWGDAKKKLEKTKHVSVSTSQRPVSRPPPLRGYDSSELFREDSLIRLRELERQERHSREG